MAFRTFNILPNKRYMPLVVTTALFFLLFGIGSIQFEGFGSTRVIANLLTDNAFLMVTAIGMTFVILAGGIDLSVGAVIALTGVICSVLIQHYHWHPLLVFPVVVLLGLIFGAAMGVLIHYYKLQPFIVTLAGMFLARGLATTISEESIAINHKFYSRIAEFGVNLPGNAWVGASTIFVLILLGLAILVAHYTRFGGSIYALGDDAQSAELMGVPIAKTTIGVYAMSSGLAAIAGIVFSFYTFSGYSLAAIGVELDAIAAVVIGGTLLSGGVGYVFGTMIGVMIMGLIQTYISFDGTLNSWWTKIVIGVLLLLFIGLQKFLGSEVLFKRSPS
ncbi:MAG: sugar ABC transporter permease YjfF [Alphaproteobacteria bacterium]|nr:MAG: sugar ABC transporter permease YjfF [Alphaproteobacteria bacterium]